MSRILILANHYNTLRIFRRELIQELVHQGNQVIVSIPSCDDENKELLESYGCSVLFMTMDRRGKNPFQDLTVITQYWKLLKEVKPDKVITYTIKPNIYGSLVCKWKKVPHYANVTGLGSTFQKEGILRKLVSLMYRFSMNKAEKVFFENEGNRDTLVQDGIIRQEQTVVLPGAGVNLDEFPATSYPEEQSPIRFLFIGRIMQEKGVDEYFDAIVRLKKDYPDTEFLFIGWYEEHYEAKVRQLEEQGLLQFYGFQPNVKPFIEKAHCIVLPSWHEGMSNTLLEASAMCRPIITTRIHGCMEAVEEGVNGYLTEKQSAESIYLAMHQFMEIPYEEKKQMGAAGRKRMEQYFDKKNVVKRTIDCIFENTQEDSPL
ncbi:MAG: glycosyltransferase family 4 protein [Lachnospiraceae bacterium]|nr:glycosyltransferase family 4 protein [Lachnospiraceae bacterium]